MSVIQSLSFRSSIDTDGFDLGIGELISRTDELTRGIGDRLADLSPSFQKATAGLDSTARSGVSGLSSGFSPVGGLIAASVIAGLGTLKSAVQDIGRTISKQLHDSFRFDQVKDGFDSTRRVAQHEIGGMKADLADFSASGQAGNTALFNKMKANIRSAENELRRMLLNSSASFKKGGLPTFDDFFTKQSPTYKGGGAKGGGGGGRVGAVSALNPIKSVSGQADSGTSALLRMVPAAGLVVGGIAAIGTASGFIARGVKGASDLNETLSKTDVILGASSPKVKAFADQMAAQFGLVKGQTLDTASSFAGLGKSLGRMNGDQLAGFATSTTKLAADLSSFSNIDFSAASEAIRTGLSGNQSDTLKELGVVLTEETTKQYAYANGIAKAGSELNEQQKFTARSALITQGLSKASGDLERTQGGAANQTRKLLGTVENLGTSIGTALLPVVTAGLNLLNEFATSATSAFEASKAAIGGWVEVILQGFDYVFATVHHLPAAFEMARLKVVEVVMNIGEVIATLGPNAATIASYIGRNWKALIVDGFNGALAVVQNFGKNLSALGTAIGTFLADPTRGFQVEWTGLLDGFEATAEKLPELLKPHLTDLTGQIAAAGSPIEEEAAARRAARAGPPGAAAAVADMPVADEDPKKKKKKKPKGGKDKDDEVKFGGALELGSKEAYSAIVSASARPSSGMELVAKSGQDTAANTGQLVRLQAERNRAKARQPERLKV